MGLNDFLDQLKEQAIYMEADDDKKKKKDDKKEEAPEDLGAGDPDADGDGTDEEPDDLSGGDDPADDEPGDDDDEQPEEPDMDADDEGEDTGDDDPLADDSEGEDDEPEDLEDGAPDEDGDDTTDEPDAGDDTDDGDMEPDDLGDDGGDSDDPDAGGDDGDMEPDDLGDDGGDGGGGGEDIKGLENEIFEDLTDEQKAIRTKELKDRFIELYNVTLAFKEKVDYVKKNSDNMKIITKVSKSLDKLSDMISYYITKTFNTKSYIENKSDFYYCLWVLDRLNELMGTLAPKEPIKK